MSCILCNILDFLLYSNLVCYFSDLTLIFETCISVVSAFKYFCNFEFLQKWKSLLKAL